ncbi:MAG: hypothetical protein SFX73_34145 [Kofleriaceae bacterium]|nr:hypothetical protein [Kofleriaceae bacterium]
MRTLAIWVRESKQGAVPDKIGDKLGTLYREPFIPVMSMWAFSTRVLQALCNHAWQPTQDENRLILTFTPSLPAGHSQVVEDLDGYRRVNVGVQPGSWNDATPAEKRRLLIEIAMRELEPVRQRWGLDGDALQHAAREMLEADPAASVGDATPIAVGEAITPLRDIDTWRATRPAERLAVARAIVERVRATGRVISAPVLVNVAGAEVVEATIDDVPFVLVPGGRMRRGFDQAQLARLDTIFTVVWGPSAEKRQKKFPRALTPFGADVACKVDDKTKVDIAPLWMAARTLDIEDARDPWQREPSPGFARWTTARALLAARRQTLPTSDELLWAASAGDARLFPWGDDAAPISELLDGDAAELAAAYGIETVERRPRPALDPFEVFASANPFGLVAPLSNETWCMPDRTPGTATPLVRVGGPLRWYPWQGGWEAMLFLTRVVSRVAFDGRVGPWRAMIRPVLHLAP